MKCGNLYGMRLPQETPHLRGTSASPVRCFIGSHHLFQWKPMTGPQTLGPHRPLSLPLNRNIRTSVSFQMDTSWWRIFLSSSNRHASVFAFPEPSPSLTHSVLMLYSPGGSPRLWHFKTAFKWSASLSWCDFSYLGKPSLVFEHTSLPYPSRTSRWAQTPVMWSCGIWQGSRPC